jgi:type IV pilus assembly protein PilE
MRSPGQNKLNICNKGDYMYKKSSGFTLIELLIVVLIIGILAAVALPQYQKAVLKSRFAALMPIAKSVADGNEMYYLTHGQYSQDPAELDVAAQDTKYPDGTDLDMVNTDKYSYVMATRDNNFPMNYIVYQKHSKNFPDNIHCEAAGTMAESVCQSLGGQVVESGSLHDGYTTYILKGSATDGKMPSSLSKLAAACANDANCTVTNQTDEGLTTQTCTGDLTGTNVKTCINITYDENGEEEAYKRTEQQCGQTVVYHVLNIVGYGSGRYAQQNSTNNGCVTKDYDKDNNLIASLSSILCSGGVIVDGECTRTSWTSGGYLVENFSDANGFEFKTVSRECLTANTDGNCAEWKASKLAVREYTPDGEGYAFHRKLLYCETFNSNGTCATYDTKKSEFTDFNTDGTIQAFKTCGSFNEDGSCAAFSAQYASSGPHRGALRCSAEDGNIDTTTGECL